ncbi:aspartic peptidase domain-containing protein [Cristinia sonorae]|uniref:Aspartic peptidase domain-containing protein n=1 Tax=Cristinia sonorae TaxID=1940300 RepID=A0A8K0XK52_9AGAR|nr:aspartic peptidase domain-containing protein [Cristinia sonorae]
MFSFSSPLTLFSLPFLTAILAANALTIPIQPRAPRGASMTSPRSPSRYSFSTSMRMASVNISGDDPFGFQSVNGILYTGIIDVNGQQYTVQLDTGSSDLWLDTKEDAVPNAFDTGVVAEIRYVDESSARGHINLANVTWGEYQIPDQAFINAPGSNASSSDGTYNGLLGVGPPSLSVVEKRLNGTPYDGSSFLDNVFSVYPDEPNYITFLLSRDPHGITDGGVFTIGEVDQNHTAILNATILPVVEGQQWTTFMDGVLINNQVFYGASLNTANVEVPDGKVIVLLDTGTSLATAPPDYVDAMYKTLPEAEFVDSLNTYVFPCEARVNISLIFGEETYPIHPIDAAVFIGLNSKNRPLCMGGFSYLDDSDVDFILGDTFLRNVYSLYDFGSWARVGDTPPYMQILSITDLETANAEFDTLLAKQVDAFVQSHSKAAAATSTSVSAGTKGALPTDAASRLSAGDGDSDLVAEVSDLKRFTYIILGLAGAAVLLLVVLVFMIARLLKNGGAVKQGKGYKALSDPASAPGQLSDHQPYSEHKPYGGYQTPYSDMH